MANASHQIVALRSLMESLYSGLANMTDATSPLVSTVAANSYGLSWLCSNAVVQNQSEPVTFNGILSVNGPATFGSHLYATDLWAGVINVSSALTSLSEALSQRLDIRSAMSGISLYGDHTLVFDIPMLYAGDTGDDPSWLATVGWVSQMIQSASYSFPIAGPTTLGAVKVGAGLTVASDGTLSANGGSAFCSGITANGTIIPVDENGYANIPAATSSAFGVVKVGSGISLSEGTISVAFPSGAVTGVYVGDTLASVSSGKPVIPFADKDTFGVVTVGDGLTVGGSGVVSVDLSRFVTGVAFTDSTVLQNTDGVVTVPYAQTDTFGVVKVGSNLSVTDGVIEWQNIFGFVNGMKIAGSSAQVDDSKLVLPSATSTAFGVVKIDGDTIRTSSTGAIYVAGGGGNVTDVMIGATSLLSNSVATIPYGSSAAFGVVKIDGSTISVNGSSQIAVNTSVIASVDYVDSYVDSVVGDINTALAEILGE